MPRPILIIIISLCLIVIGLANVVIRSGVDRQKKAHARHVVEVAKSTILRENSGLATDVTQKYATRGEYECLISDRDTAREDSDYAGVYRECQRIISGETKGAVTDAKYGALRQENKDFGFCFSVLEARKDLDNLLAGLDEGSLSVDFVLAQVEKIEVRVRVKATELRAGFYDPQGLQQVIRTP